MWSYNDYSFLLPYKIPLQNLKQTNKRKNRLSDYLFDKKQNVLEIQCLDNSSVREKGADRCTNAIPTFFIPGFQVFCVFLSMSSFLEFIVKLVLSVKFCY